MDETTARFRSARRSFSIVGFGFVMLILVSLLAQTVFLLLPELLGCEDALEQTSWWIWVSSSAPLYLFAFPACILVLRFLPGKAPEPNRMTGKQFLTMLPICLFLMYSGNLIGSLLSMLLSGGQAVNELDSYAMGSYPLKIVVMVILAPVLEEWLCRKVLIDRTVRYGEKLSVLLSGLIFGLLHGNFFQFFYAFALGSLFAYVYIRTGRIRYTMIFHAMINFMGAVVAPGLLAWVEDALPVLEGTEITIQDMAAVLPQLSVLAVYSMTLLGLSVLGLVLLIIKCHYLIWKETEQQLSGKQGLKAALLNVGMILYTLICIGLFILALFNK